MNVCQPSDGPDVRLPPTRVAPAQDAAIPRAHCAGASTPARAHRDGEESHA
ncbi:hypothetical protein ACH4PU_31020 [Streptomyces sp. NPDC021100]|uniref:hypothetical protein n=1 Tax=Streptomyces sp. NPDC021100 TaxID=3365114 RepID=UPI0037933D44